MNIYNYLKKDHETVAALFEEAVAAGDAVTREELFEQIRSELDLHAKTEEKTFYAAIKKGNKELKEKEKHAEEEHDEMEELLEKVSGLDAESAEWLVALGELKHCVEHHVEEEEEEIFKMAKKIISKEESIELTEKMEAMKQKLLSRKAAA